MGKETIEFVKESVLKTVTNLYFLTENEENRILYSIKSEIEDKIKKSYKNITGKDINLPKIGIGIDNSIKDGKIAGMKHPEDGGDYSFIGVKSKALKNLEYLKWVITHELIHVSVGEDMDELHNHSGLFDRIADEIGLPEKYRK